MKLTQQNLKLLI